MNDESRCRNFTRRHRAALTRLALQCRRWCRPPACERGTSLVEFAISVPVLFMLLLGFAQVCQAVYCSFCINETARDTARWASVRGANSCADAPGLSGCGASLDEIQAFAKSIDYPGINPSSLTVSTSWLQASSTTPVSWSDCSSSQTICNAPGNAVKVVVTYPFALLIPYSVSSTLNFSSTSQLVVVQ